MTISAAVLDALLRQPVGRDVSEELETWWAAWRRLPTERA